MQLKPEILEHWDAFNEYRDSLTLYELGPIYMIIAENVFTVGQGNTTTYWSTRESVDAEVTRIKKKWSKTPL